MTIFVALRIYKYMESHKPLYLCIILCLIRLGASAKPISTENYLFHQLSISQGMPASIQSVYAEKGGFVWVSTRKGLGRFDGYELKLYTHDAGDPYSLPGNEVYQVVEDSLCNIWVLTDGGLALYDKKTARFLRDMEGGPVYATTACHWRGGMLFSSRAALFYYEYDSRRMRKIADYGGWGSFVKTIVPWDEHTLLCLRQWEGLFLLDVRTGRMRPAPVANSEQVTRILLDSHQRLWATSYNKGLVCFDRTGRLLGSYDTGNSALRHDIILCMVEYEGEIWLGTDGGGINILNPETNEFRVLPYLPGDKNSLPDNSVQSLCVDGDNLWVGSVKGGLICLRSSCIRSYTDVPLNTPYGLSEKAVLALCQENISGDIWIGTDGGGINRFEPHERRFVHYPQTWGEKVMSLCSLNPRELLVTLFAKGVFAFDKQKGTFRRMNDLVSIEQAALYGRKSVFVYRDSPSSILILSSAIYRYFPDKGQVRRLTPEAKEAKGVFASIGQEGPYTYLHDMEAVYSLDSRNDSLKVLYSVAEPDVLLSACRDDDGRFWLGMQDGLLLYDPITQSATTPPAMKYKLKGVSSLLYDNGHRLWIGAEDGLYVWLPERKKLIALDESDGVQPNAYMERAVLNASQGGIYIGGINGLVCVDKDVTGLDAIDLPTLSLGDIVCEGESRLGQVDEHTRKLAKSVDDGIVTVKLMTHTDDRFRKRMYRWQIDGADTQVAESREPTITLRSLSPGTYRILASCSTKDNGWTPLSPIVTFTVPPAWYQTWWFVLLSALLVAGMLLLWVLYLIRRKEEKMALRLKEHKQQIYEEKVRFLININHELRTPLTLIHAPLIRILHDLPSTDVNYSPLKKVLKQTKRMRGLLDMVLSLRKMEMKESKLQLAPYPLNEWLQDTVNDFQYEGEERHIRLNCETDPAIGEVSFDKEKNVIILTNLIVNAFKHSPDGSTLTIRTELLEEEGVVRISVIDQGEGLKGVDAAQLFTRFYQGEDAKDGAGIGLSYAKILVEEHRGRIGACEAPDGGACFWYELPVRQAAATIVSQPQEYLNRLMNPVEGVEPGELQATTGSVDTHNYVCLFVDDNADLQELVADSFRGQFKKLLMASDGYEALECVKSEMPDVVISDVMMPRMNGYELCNQIKANPDLAYVQVILLTARTDGQSRADGYKMGADAYVEKPFEPDLLLEVVRNRLFLREQLKSRYASSVSESGKNANSADDAFLYKVNKLIEEHLGEESLDVAFLCEQMGTSRASLYNRVKAQTGMGPNNYINKFRMERAAEMLKQTELNMTEIAERTGFSSSRYFSTTFKKYMGVTPTQYKNASCPDAEEGGD